MNIKLPYTPTHLIHRHGGTILEVLSIGHRVATPAGGRSRDAWFYVCRISWDDGSGDTSREWEVPPICVCYLGDEGHAEVCALNELLGAYLLEHGKWNEASPQGWYANDRSRLKKRAA
jgi:hypothetical protein